VAEEIAALGWLLLWLGTAVFVMWAGLLGAAIWRRRRRGEARISQRDEPAESTGYVRRWVVGLGVVMTSIVLVAVMAATVASMRAIPSEAPSGALRLELVARQFHWDVRYPGSDARTRDVVRIPAGRPVELTIRSADVIHSFWVPALTGKLDAIPGQTNTLVIQADRPGTYGGQCAEYCGLEHALMRVTVVAMEPSAFDEWLEGAD
jgi:cytochrome c oxidase subunit 2